ARVLDRGRHVPAPHEPRARRHHARRRLRAHQPRALRRTSGRRAARRGRAYGAGARAGAGERVLPGRGDEGVLARGRGSRQAVHMGGPLRPLCWSTRQMLNVLLTNDDGIEADGLQAMRSALVALDEVNLAVIAPDGNRSAMARSITTRRPLWVQETPFADGTVGYATDGTPVDCVRLASL